MFVIQPSYKRGLCQTDLNFCGMKPLRMAADPQKCKSLNPQKLKRIRYMEGLPPFGWLSSCLTYIGLKRTVKFEEQLFTKKTLEPDPVEEVQKGQPKKVNFAVEYVPI